MHTKQCLSQSEKETNGQRQHHQTWEKLSRSKVYLYKYQFLWKEEITKIILLIKKQIKTGTRLYKKLNKNEKEIHTKKSV